MNNLILSQIHGASCVKVQRRQSFYHKYTTAVWYDNVVVLRWGIQQDLHRNQTLGQTLNSVQRSQMSVSMVYAWSIVTILTYQQTGASNDCVQQATQLQGHKLFPNGVWSIGAYSMRQAYLSVIPSVAAIGIVSGNYISSCNISSNCFRSDRWGW